VVPRMIVSGRRVRRLVWTGIALCSSAVAVSARVASAHPLHTTLVQLTLDERTRTVESSIRVFASDFAAAVAKRKGATVPSGDLVSDAEAMTYVRTTFLVSDASGHALPLAWCGSRRAGDVLWLCVRAMSTAPPNEVMISDQMLCELFDDQINIVQTTNGRKRASMLFTKGDRAKRAM
jgi:uncharacterized protein DUF6702